MNQDQARRLVEMMNMPGWRDAHVIADEQISDAEESVFSMMTSNPDKLTGKTAIAKANRAKGVREFIEAVEDARKIFDPSTQQGQG